MTKFISSLLLLFLWFPTLSQVTITIGTGAQTNTGTSYPSPYGNWYWGARHQFVILASELTAQGMSAGDINALGFEVASPAGTPLSGFTVSMKNTATGSLNTFETGLTQVFGPQTFTESGGWNMHSFSSPFYWDGTSNLLIETCFNNNSFTNNAVMFQSNTSFNSSVYVFQDMNGVCSNTTASGQTTMRPNMRLIWDPGNVPPVADFYANTTYSCSGQIDFYDQSTNNPTSWLWDFGDGNTSTQQNPTHLYTIDGTYDVTLTATNAFGNDVEVKTNYITINTSGGSPGAINCSPATTSYCCGFGITEFNFNTISNQSGDGVEGYSDFTCQQTTLTEGQTYAVDYVTDNPQPHHSAVWIDLNNDGQFDDVNERMFTATSELNPSGQIYIPQGAVLNTPLRLRVSADYELSAPPTPCSQPDYGQVEDYTVVIQANTNPPVAQFSVSDTITCDGSVSFFDESLNLPTGWQWDFGDGNTSFQQNPTHTYAADGNYTVTLIATNSFGSDDTVMTALVTVNLSGALTAASCTPNTLSYCCGYGIYQVEFNSINYGSDDGAEGYMDFSCEATTTITETISYPIDIRTGQNNAQDTKVWIDLNNDGTLDDATETVFSSTNAFNPSGSITISGAGIVYYTPLRMRITSDYVGAPLTPCYTPQNGQVEDYGVIIDEATLEPIADFTADSPVSCDFDVQFTDLSLQAPTSWIWDFGDGNTSNQQNPLHTYSSTGTYHVKLVVSNQYGSDSIIKLNYITIDTTLCDTVVMPNTSSGIVVTECNGVLVDDGGASGDYSNDINSYVTIMPPNAQSITLNFLSFDFEQGFDFLYVYDGPSTGSPLIGQYDGINLPNGGQITSSGGAITIQQMTDFSIVESGFIADWSCVPNSVPELMTIDFTVYPNPSDGRVRLTFDDFVKEALIEVYDVTGRKIFSERETNISSGPIDIDLSHAQTGTYFIRVSSESRINTQTIIIE